MRRSRSDDDASKECNFPAKETEMWRIRCNETLDVLDPSGRPVAFQTRHERAIVGLLAVAPDHCLGRTRLGSLIWPGRDPSKTQQSLRRAFCNIRESLGGRTGPFISDRRICRLDPDQCVFDVTESCQEVMLRRLLGDAVIESSPEFNLDARRPLSPEPYWSSSTEAATSLLNALEWVAIKEPSAALDMLYKAMHLAEFAPPDRLNRFLETVGPNVSIHDPRIGYVHFLRAISLGYQAEVAAAERWLRVALTHAAGCGMPDLAADVQFYRSCHMLVHGDCEKGLRLAMEAEAALCSACDLASQCRLRHGVALALMHCGHFHKGFQAFDEAADLALQARSRVATQYVLANRAFFEATVGDLEKAKQFVRTFEGEGPANYRLWITKELALAAIQTAEGHDGATRRLEHIEEICDRLGQLQTQVYRLEILATHHVNHGRQAEARRTFAESQRLRQRIGMKITVWDRTRLQPLATFERALAATS